MPFVNLPDDVFSVILSFLSPSDALLRVSQISTRMNDYVRNDDPLWRCIFTARHFPSLNAREQGESHTIDDTTSSMKFKTLSHTDCDVCDKHCGWMKKISGRAGSASICRYCGAIICGYCRCQCRCPCGISLLDSDWDVVECSHCHIHIHCLEVWSMGRTCENCEQYVCGKCMEADGNYCAGCEEFLCQECELSVLTALGDDNMSYFHKCSTCSFLFCPRCKMSGHELCSLGMGSCMGCDKSFCISSKCRCQVSACTLSCTRCDNVSCMECNHVKHCTTCDMFSCVDCLETYHCEVCDVLFCGACRPPGLASITICWNCVGDICMSSSSSCMYPLLDEELGIKSKGVI